MNSMAEHIWKLVEVLQEDCDIQCTYRNELGEEYVHVVDCYGISDSMQLHACCWSGCSGDWPGCRSDCPLFTDLANEMLQKHREHERVDPPDPFNFMLNKTEGIDAHNCYVETFDTLDGTHWEIAVDISRQIMEQLEAKIREEEENEC